MTTIFIDFKNKKIVADRQRTSNLVTKGVDEEASVSYSEACKIHRMGDGVYLVGAGNSDEISRQAMFYRENRRVDHNVLKDCTLAVIRNKGDSLFVDTYQYVKKQSFWLVNKGTFKRESHQCINYITFGSGSDAAEVLFLNGFSAEEAVRGASKVDIYTSYEIDVVDLKEEES